MSRWSKIRDWSGWRWWRRKPVVSIIRLSGVIGMAGPLRGGLTLQGVAPILERAFEPSRLVAVALVINSPGGSPVQSALIGRRIRQLAEENEVPVLGFVEDVAASGGYWLACACDEIYADENSIVGSIGVISAGFGFQDLIARHGIERRVHVAGEQKMMLDPFQPERADDVERLKALQVDIHDGFRQMVRGRRGDRLKGDDESLFSGAFWTGRRALDLGLIDGIDDYRSLLRARFGKTVRLRPIEEDRGWFARHVSLTRSPDVWAAAVTDAVAATVEARALWARYGR